MSLRSGIVAAVAPLALAAVASSASPPVPPDSNTGVAPSCTVQGEVVEIQQSARRALVKLRQPYGSSTMTACGETGAAAMAQRGEIVSVPLDAAPRPSLAKGDTAFVSKDMGPDFSLMTLPAAELNVESISRRSQISWEGLSRTELLYEVKALVGLPAALRGLSEIMDLPGDDLAAREKRANAGVLLIELAQDRQPVPAPLLRKAFLAALADSYHGVELAEHTGSIVSDRAGFVGELDGLLGRKAAGTQWPAVRDPYGIIVALGVLGPVSKAALPSVVERMNGSTDQTRGGGDVLFAAAVKRMKAEGAAARLFMDRVKAGRLASDRGPLARGACLLTSSQKAAPGLVELARWCRAHPKP